MHQQAHSRLTRFAISILTTFAIGGMFALPLAFPGSAWAENIFIDPGHGGRYPGAYYGGVSEANLNLWISLEVQKKLRELGHDINMSRTTSAFTDPGDIPTWHYWDPDGDDIHYVQYALDGRTGIYDYSGDGAIPYDDLQKRCDLANNWEADLFISIHNNASTSSSARGTETYYNWDNAADIELSGRLAEYVQREIILSTGMPDRGTGDVGYYVIRWANMPGILIECGYMSNYTDRSLLLSTTFRERLAEGIAAGIQRFLDENPFEPVYDRLAGTSRFSTAAAVAHEGWPTGADTVVVASGENWPDSLAAVPLSAKLDAPILLTRASSLPTETAEAIATLDPTQIIVVGGEAAVHSDVASQAAAIISIETSEVVRIAGANRYDTARAIAETVGPSPEVVVVSGESFPDAVSAGAYAGREGYPILLTRRGSCPTATLEYIESYADELERTTVVGGAGVICDDVLDQLAKHSDADRVWGSTRYTTNLALIRKFWPTETITPFVASANDYPDALVAGTLAAKQGRPVMLLGRQYLNPYQREWLRNDASRIDGFTMIGGENALRPIMDYQLVKAMADNRFAKD